MEPKNLNYPANLRKLLNCCLVVGLEKFWMVFILSGETEMLSAVKSYHGLSLLRIGVFFESLYGLYKLITVIDKSF